MPSVCYTFVGSDDVVGETPFLLRSSNRFYQVDDTMLMVWYHGVDANNES